MKFLKFSRKQTERGYEILKFLGARRFGLRAAELLNLTPAPSRNGFKILKFTPEPLRNRFEILKFALASARLADTAQNFISRNGFKILKLVCEPLRALHRVLSRVDSAKTVRAEKFSKFGLTNALLNFISLLLRKFKLALLKFMREVPRDRSEILKFTSVPRNQFEILKFTLTPRKFKPASISLLNFISNFTPPVSAAKFENGVKFKGATKFKRGAL